MKFHRLSILIVDAWQDAAESLAYMLELHGHQISISRDGKSAIEAIKTRSPDVAVIDAALRRMDGNEVARQICKLQCQKPLLIATSGYGQIEDREAACQAGFDHFLVKPFAPRELIVLLERFGERLSGSVAESDERVVVLAH